MDRQPVEFREMIVEEFDRRTMAKMEVALNRVCQRFPLGGKHKIRKRVAKRIVRCAKTGTTDLDALIEAGESALARPSIIPALKNAGHIAASG